MPDLEEISVGIVPKKIESIFEDIWTYKLLECKKGAPLPGDKMAQRGTNTSVVFRERAFKPIYAVYLKIKDEDLASRMIDALNKPQRSSYLGQSDELVLIRHVEDVTKKAEIKEITDVNSSFYGMKIKKYCVNGAGLIVPPRKVPTQRAFSFDGINRIQKEMVDMIDFYGVTVTVDTSFEGVVFENEHVFLY